jgi:hypothetical protein
LGAAICLRDAAMYGSNVAGIVGPLATSDLHELVVDPVVNMSGARRTLTNSGEQIPDASTIVRFGRGAPGGQGVAGKVLSADQAKNPKKLGSDDEGLVNSS